MVCRIRPIYKEQLTFTKGIVAVPYRFCRSGTTGGKVFYLFLLLPGEVLPAPYIDLQNCSQQIPHCSGEQWNSVYTETFTVIIICYFCSPFSLYDNGKLASEENGNPVMRPSLLATGRKNLGKQKV